MSKKSRKILWDFLLFAEEIAASTFKRKKALHFYFRVLLNAFK